MISQNQIARLVETEEFRQLVDRVLANGRCRSAMARRVLSQPDVAAPAGIGLAVQRLSEITYRPTNLADTLARALVQMQRRDGFFGYSDAPSGESLLAATAVALRGLMTYRNQHLAAGLEVQPSIESAIDQGLSALEQKYAQSNDINADAVGWAIVLWQLGDVASFRLRIPVSSLLAMLNETATDLVEDELCRYAFAMAA